MRRKQIIYPKLNDCNGKLNKSWFIYYSYYDEFNGKMKRFRIYNGFSKCSSRQERYAHARKLINKWRNKLNSGYNPFTDNKGVLYTDNLKYLYSKEEIKLGRRRALRTVNYYMNKYLEKRKSRLSKATYQKYQSQFRIFNSFLEVKQFEELDISVVDNKVVTEFFNYLQEERSCTGKTLNSYKTLLEALWRHAIKDNHLLKSPFSDIERFREETMPQKPFKRGILVTLKNYLEEHDPQLWLAAQFQFYCFIRPKELRFLRLKHIDMFEGIITLTSDITKNARNRTVYIPEQFQQDLLTKYYLQNYPEELYVFTTRGVPGSNPVSKNYFWQHFDNVRKKLNMPKEYSFYGFKHTGAVIAVSNGASIHTIKEQMGHSSISITEEYLKDKTGYEDEFFRKKMPSIDDLKKTPVKEPRVTALMLN